MGQCKTKIREERLRSEDMGTISALLLITVICDAPVVGSTPIDD